jgi:hypothetical protein
VAIDPGVREIKYQNICEGERKKLAKGEFEKSLWIIGSGRTRGKDPYIPKYQVLGG